MISGILMLLVAICATVSLKQNKKVISEKGHYKTGVVAVLLLYLTAVGYFVSYFCFQGKNLLE